MYNPLLDTFLVVAECGSFTKASEKLFISPTAIMKQINSLESHLNIKLLNRTPSGAVLTSAGKVIFRDAKFIKDYSEKSIAAARAEESRADTTFCVGTSLLNPAKVFMDLWYKYNSSFPDFKLHLVPFEDDHNGILSEIGNLGKKFDFLIGVCDSKAWMSLCEFLPLGFYNKTVSVPRKHRLAEKSTINLEDLYGETLMMVKKGDSVINDYIRNDIETNHPQIKIEDTPQFYDLSVFNRCAESGNVLLSIECWKDVHPGLVSLKVNWDYKIPYGLLYSKFADADVKRFVETVKQRTA